MKNSAGSVTRLIPKMLDRDEYAIEELWRRYLAQVQGVVRPVLTGLPPGGGDEEDVAQSAFCAFFDAAAKGQAPDLESRDELWRLLATISRRKAVDRVRHELRDRRGGGVPHDRDALQHVPDEDPSPSKVAQLQEVLDHLFLELDETGDSILKTIAVMRLEGITNQEIAKQLDCTVRTVQRKLHILERLWTSRDE